MARFDCTALPEWTDYNGHMRDAYFRVVFSLAIDSMMDDVGLDADYRRRTSGTLYTAEDHSFYRHEVRAGAAIHVDSRVLDFDAKRIILTQRLFAAGHDGPAAVCESLQLHVVQQPVPKVAPMPEAILANIARLKIDQTDFRAGPIVIRHRPRED